MALIGLLLSVGLLAALSGGLSDSGSGGVDIEDEVREGDEGDDTLVGDNGLDILSGEGGNDDLTGRGGEDILLGGEGDDLLKGRTGDDILQGGEGDDTLLGGYGDDILLGSGGDDDLRGGNGNDTLIGADVFSRDLTVDDILDLASNPNQVPVGYTDEIPSQEEANTLDGGMGDDAFLLGEGDTATGGQGNDIFEVAHWVAGEDSPLITDFTEENDLLVVQYQASSPPPTITIQEVGDERHVFANGSLVARVAGGDGPHFASDVRLFAV